MIKVWGRKSSSNVQAVLWCLGELGLEFDRVDAGFKYGVVNTAEYLNMNPNGTVPCLQDGHGEPLWESGAIMRYLANRYADESFWPADLHLRAQVDKWAEWSKLNVAGNYTSPVFWQVVRIPVERRNAELIDSAVKNLEKYLQIADHRLTTSQYLAGETLTLADIQFGHCLYRYFDVDIKRAQLDNLTRYYNLLCTSPHFCEHVKVDYSELVNSL